MGTYYVAGITYSDELYHHGIKGQKWGVRNGPPYPLEEKNTYEQQTNLKVRTNKGEEVSIGQRPTPKFAQFVSKYIPSIKDNIMRDKQFNITVDGKRIGDAEVYRKSDEELNVVWVGIDESERGKGYASAVMKGIVNYSKAQGFKKVTLEVPGISPDARHIYEKLGFKATKVISDTDDVWGGLTAMELINRK